MVLKVFGVLTQFALSNPLFVGALGLINRMMGRRLFTSVFLAYPANAKIVRRFSFEWAQPFFRMRPATIGFFLVHRELSLVVSIGAVEKDIFAFTAEELALLDQRLERLQKLLGAKTRTMAGVLPSVMARAGVGAESPSRASTVRIVGQVIRSLYDSEMLPKEAPVVVVGAQGFIGQGVCEELATTHQVIGLEKSDNVAARLSAIPGRHLVVNIASYRAWKDILAGLAPGAVVLNEVYPPPHGAVAEALRERGAAFHVSGVRTQWSFPSLGEGYDQVMPCCAATGDPALWEPVVVKL